MNECFQRALRQITGQQRIRHVVRIDELHGGQIVANQLVSELLSLQMLAHGLHGVGLPIGIMMLLGQHIASCKIVKLGLVDFLTRAIEDDAARTNVIQVIQQLGGVLCYLAIDINLVDGIER